MNSSTKILVLGISAFLAFSIGLNLGLMGFFHQPPLVVMSPPPDLGIEQTLQEKPFDPPPQTVLIPQIPVTTPRPTLPPTKPLPPPPPKKSAGPIGQFIEGGGQFPIALLTCNRVELLDQSIRSRQSILPLPPCDG
jgi:hypothetical protein